MHPPLVDAGGSPLDPDDLTRPPVNAKRLFFDWSSVAAIAIAAMTYAALAGDVKANAREIERLREAGDARAQSDVRIAETMATKEDVQRVSDQVQALALELRSSRGVVK